LPVASFCLVVRRVRLACQAYVWAGKLHLLTTVQELCRSRFGLKTRWPAAR
jgi:hypothetical protein